MKKTILLLFVLPFLGMAQTTLPTFWSFVNPSPAGAASSNPSGPASDGPTGWTTKLDVSNSGTTPFVYATGSDGSAACRLDAAGEYVQIWFAEKPGQLSYYIRGTAIGTPAFSGVFNIQESADGLTWTNMSSLTTMSGSFTRHTETPAATSRYIRFYYDTKVSGSNVALDSVYLAKPGPSNAATINLKRGTTALANGTTFVNGKASVVDFTIENLGLVDALAISSISVTGTNAADYSITNAPSSVAATGSAVFSVNFNPANAGSSKAQLVINSNDADNGTFVVNLYGIGGDFATEPTVQPADLTFSNVRAYTFNVRYTNASVKPEGYIVLRKKGAPVNEVPVDGQTYMRGDYIGGTQVAYVGTDTSFKPSYILAGSDYFFKVFSFNGPATFENYLTAAPLSGSVTTSSGNPGNYYNGISSSSASFVTDLGAKITVHDTIFYSNYTPTMINNFVTRDTTGGKKVVNCVYTGIPYIYDEPFLWWGNSTGGVLTREHTFAQSWMPSNNASQNPNFPNAPNGRELQEYNDLHHLFPANQTLGNNVRSNNPLGEVVTITSQNGEGKIGKDANGKTVYEPRDEHKGDAARAMFYMCAAYNGVKGNNWSLGNITKQQDEAILKKWHFQDLPDAWEIARNEYVASLQHNRNPFIDSVNFVCRINFTNMTWIAAPDQNCGVVVPALSITSPVGGENLPEADQSTITWTSNALSDSITIELYVNDTLNRVVGKAKATDGTFTWTPGGPRTTQAKIRLSYAQPALSSMSPANFTISGETALDELLDASALHVYPNPSNGIVNIDIASANVKDATVIVTDITGRTIMSKQLSGKQAQIELSRKGVYFLMLQTEKGYAVQKLMITE
jgi:hypothetical protein